MTEEVWRPIPGWDKYDVSNHGRVRSRMKGGEPVLRNLYISVTGHRRAYLCREGFSKAYFVHRLVLEAFVGPCPPDKKDAAHLDGDPANNRVENLKWATRSENMLHMRDHGTMQMGETHPGAKASDAMVIDIRRSFRDGVSVRELVKRHGLSSAATRSIIKGTSWGHLSMEGLPKHENKPKIRRSKTLETYEQEIRTLRDEVSRLQIENARLRELAVVSGSDNGKEET